MGRGFSGQLGELLGIDADREYRGAGSPMARIDDAATHGEPEILLRIRQKILAILLVLFPILLCFGLGYMYAAEERAFEDGAEAVKGTVKAVHNKTRFNGRDSEDITTALQFPQGFVNLKGSMHVSA